jgi:hypothetical protein
MPQHPFELAPDELARQLDAMVDATFRDLQSQFLVLPKKKSLIEYVEFQAAYEVLKRHMKGFSTLKEEAVWAALREDALGLVVLRTVLGMSPGEWAELARQERASDVSTSFARGIDVEVREKKDCLARMRPGSLKEKRLSALISVAVEYIYRGAPPGAEDTVHRLAKADTAEGLTSLQHVATEHVPYSVLLYERYLGRPFASYRDSISELVGDVMESAIEERLRKARITFRKTGQAERIPGFAQAPDFFVPTEFAPTVIVEAKITGDDGTARDKVARILRLATMRDERLRAGRASFEVVACIDGRGFGVRRQDMRDMLTATLGKVFTLATLDRLIEQTRLKDHVSA